MDRIWIAVLASVTVILVAAVLVFLRPPEENGWVKVPGDNSQYKQLPGDEVTIRGLLEANDRTILAIPTGGKPFLITETEVDGIVAEGMKGQHDFRDPGWTHRIRLDDSGMEPDFVIDGEEWFVILSTGTDVWRSENLLRDYEGTEVEMIGKWDSYMTPDHPTISVIQFRARSIRKVE